MSKRASYEVSNEEARILAWMYMVEVSGDNQAAESLKQDLPRSLQEWSHRNNLENLTRTYETVRQHNHLPPVEWE
ncbi:MAG: hypothetical protein J0I20_12145 [Chloroflexi bacterium]|nr:hypothetical protein [Chloroflexota bacterium]OJV92476.1 MAG: hypothetical protein BGO39_31655 [Chloroflexi bacterium 54-19]